MIDFDALPEWEVIETRDRVPAGDKRSFDYTTCALCGTHQIVPSDMAVRLERKTGSIDPKFRIRYGFAPLRCAQAKGLVTG